MKQYILLIILLLSFSTSGYAIFDVYLTGTDPSCSNIANGYITTSVLGGQPPYSYLWSNGSTSPNIFGLTSGPYSVTVTDLLGATCTGQTFLNNIGNQLPPTFIFYDSGGAWSIPCSNQCNGIAYLVSQPSSWPPSANSLVIQNSTNPNLIITQINGIPAITNICVDDSIEVIVTNDWGCPYLIQISPWWGPSSCFAHTLNIEPSCLGQSDGQVVFHFLNQYSFGGFHISYTGPQSGSLIAGSNATVSGLPSGNYSFTISYPKSLSCDTVISVVVPGISNNCGLISGSVILDTISNCQLDIGEPLVPQQLIRLDPGPYFITSDSSGNFVARLPYNTYTATLLSPMPLHPVCNISSLVLSPANYSISNIILGDTINSSIALHTGLVSSAFTPGVTGILYVNVSNDSYFSIANSQLDIYFDTLLTFQSSTLIPIANNPGHLTFNIDTIHRFSFVSIPIHFQMPVNPSLIGATLSFVATAHASQPEPDTTDNTDILVVNVSGSFHPNDKAVWPSRDSLNSYYTDLDNELRYTIHFQNTGTDTAFNVVIVDTLPLALNPSTFQLIAASHPVQVEFSGQNNLSFHFNNIQLPDSNVNEPASHGAVSFSIEPFVPVTVPSLENRAHIYFDLNPPVLTNTVSSLVTVSVGIPTVSGRNAVRFIPNPANDKLSLLLPADFDAASVQLYSITGQEVLRTTFIKDSQLDVSLIKSGYYLVKVQSVNGEQLSGGLVIQH